METEPSPPTREEEILEAALELFFERGYRAVGLRELANAVGLNIATLYHYFTSKDEILLRLQEDGMRRLVTSAEEALDGVSGKGPTVRLRALIETHLRYHTSNYKIARLHFAEYRSLAPRSKETIRELMKTYERMFVDTIQDGVAKGAFHSPSPKITAFAILGAGSHVAYWYDPDGDVSADLIERAVEELVMLGVRGTE